MLSKYQKQFCRGLRPVFSYSLHKQSLLHSGTFFSISTTPQANAQIKFVGVKQKEQTQQSNSIQSLLSKLASKNLMNRKEFDEIYFTTYKINLNDLPFNDLYTLILFYGTTKYRNIDPQKCFNAIVKLLNAAKTRDVLQEAINNPGKLWQSHSSFFSDVWPHLIIQVSNLNLLDNQLYEKFLEYAKFDSGKNLRNNPIPVKRLLSLITAYRRVGLEDPEFEAIILEEIYAKKNEIIFSGLLRMAWILSVDAKNSMSPERYKEIKTYFVREFFQNISKQKDFSYNLKNSFHICQAVLNLFPEVAVHTTTDINSQNTDYNINEDLLFKAVKGSRYEDLFETCYQHYKIALWVITTGYKPQNIKMSYPAYYATNFDLNLYVFKPLFNQKTSHAENLILKILKDIKSLKVHRGKQIGPYEVDFFIEPDIILEINGAHHFITSPNARRLTPNYDLKLKHLKLFGFKKFATIDDHEWERVDNSYPKQRAIIAKALREVGLDLN